MKNWNETASELRKMAQYAYFADRLDDAEHYLYLAEYGQDMQEEQIKHLFEHYEINPKRVAA
jgi:hypothetical protein